MGTDENGMTDGLDVQLLGDALRGELEQRAAGAPVEQTPLPARPAPGASKAAWLDYVVALGGDRAALEGDTAHWSETAGAYVAAEASTKAQLVELADRLGG